MLNNATPSSSTSLPESPADVYKRLCNELHVKCNSGLLTMIPTDVKGWSTLRHLDFSRNYLGWSGVLPALRLIFYPGICNQLETLDLSHNSLSNESIAELYALMTAQLPDGSISCPQLHSLQLSQNPISCPAGKLLSRLVDHRTALRRVLVEDTLMNAGLARLISVKCAKKSPRYVGLVALSMAAVESRNNSQPPHRPNVELPMLQAALVATKEDVAADEMTSGSTSGLQSSHRIAAPNNTVGNLNTPSSVPSTTASVTKRGGSSPHLVAAARDAGADGGVGDVEWSAMETIWTLAAVAAPPEDGGWSGLAAVMALVRQDVSIASMY